MEFSDMLDVIHYIFEEDSVYVSKEELHTRDSFRERVYEGLYETTYPYIVNELESSTDGLSSSMKTETSYSEYEDLTPIDPLKPPTKGYVPPTHFNPNSPLPFGSALDAPLGG